MTNNKKAALEEIQNDTLIGVEKRRGRKSKKQNTTEILHAFQIEQDQIEEDLQTTVAPRQDGQNNQGYTKKNYENFAYLSPKERAIFEKKFTVPKNIHQEMYCKMLKRDGLYSQQ